jgi:hypothetical protein
LIQYRRLQKINRIPQCLDVALWWQKSRCIWYGFHLCTPWADRQCGCVPRVARLPACYPSIHPVLTDEKIDGLHDKIQVNSNNKDDEVHLWELAQEHGGQLGKEVHHRPRCTLLAVNALDKLPQCLCWWSGRLGARFITHTLHSLTKQSNVAEDKTATMDS